MILGQPELAVSDRDVCIIGSGPVGITLALECATLGLSVVMLESGGVRPTKALADASRAEIVDSARHDALSSAVVRALGGTSWTWGGRCVPFDDVDFVGRPHVPGSDWPLQHNEIKPWYDKAFSYLGGAGQRSPLPRLDNLNGRCSCDRLEWWSKEPQLARIHQEKLERSQAIIVHLDSTVIEFDIDEAGRVTPIIAGRNGPIRVAARYVALAAGGLESTRLLLAARARRPHLFGGLEGPLGRFYMGHLSGKIASLVLTHPADATNFDFEVDCEGNFVRRRFVINDDVQLAEKLMNVAFWLDNPPLNDPRHGSGTLSAVFVALAIPPLGRRLTSEKIRLDYVGSSPHNYAGHGRNIVFDAPRSVANIVALLHNRFVKRMPGFLVRNRKGRYALHYHAEHAPNPDSRVTLSDERDAFGLRRLRIDFRVADRDALSVVRAHRVLEQSLSASDQGMLDYWYPRERLLDEVMRQARSGGTHQLGTTRMGTDSATSVVDSNLKVHSLANLYVASSSTLPTASQANLPC